MPPLSLRYHVLNNEVDNILGILMDFEFTRDERNELLKRREVSFTLTYDGPTPSRKEIIGKCCALLSLDPDLAVLDSLKSRYGEMRVRGVIRIYDDKETRDRLEEKYLMERGVAGEVGEA